DLDRVFGDGFGTFLEFHEQCANCPAHGLTPVADNIESTKPSSRQVDAIQCWTCITLDYNDGDVCSCVVSFRFLVLLAGGCSNAAPWCTVRSFQAPEPDCYFRRRERLQAGCLRQGKSGRWNRAAGPLAR